MSAVYLTVAIADFGHVARLFVDALCSPARAGQSCSIYEIGLRAYGALLSHPERIIRKPIFPAMVPKSKRSNDSQLPDGNSDAPAGGLAQPFRVLVFSADDALAALVESALRPGWRAVRVRVLADLPKRLRLAHLRVVVVDDAGITPDDRGWLMNRIHRDVPFASIIYVAAVHSEAVERAARGNGAKYYTAAPLQTSNFAGVVRGFLGIHGDPLAFPPSPTRGMGGSR
ncbi:MAG: hypothetical protein ACREQE_05855 [Candidatus Binataceae bacterium]